MERALWSPSRVKSALQCGRRLQGSEEGWPKSDHVNGVRGGIAHTAIETWENKGREYPVREAVVDAWEAKLKEVTPGFEWAGVDVVDLCDRLSSVWGVEAEIRADEDVVAEKLSTRYKRPRATKAFEADTAFLADARKGARKARMELAGIVDSVDWPWLHEKPILDQGFDHSLETARRGAEYLTELYPEPDILGAEWNLEATLANGYRVHGYIDRVEMTDLGVEVVDYKSSKFQDTELDHFIQIATYAVIAEDHIGFAPKRVRLAYLRDQDSDVFEVQDTWRESLAALVAQADDVLARHAFAPSFAGCGICGFFPICQNEFMLTPVLLEASA